MMLAEMLSANAESRSRAYRETASGSEGDHQADRIQQEVQRVLAHPPAALSVLPRPLTVALIGEDVAIDRRDGLGGQWPVGEHAGASRRERGG